MKYMKIQWLTIVCIALLVTGACKKNSDNDSNPANATLSIRMTDAPAYYDAVLIDLQAVEITSDAGNNTMLNVNAGIYNLLDFANGVDTLIATGNLQAGKIEQVRLILGSNNTIVVNGVSHPLSTPSAEQSGLKLQVHNTLLAGVAYELLLDFDASKSIVETGNGTYKLKPVIRVIETAISGSIKGIVMPAGAHLTVTAIAGAESYGAITNTNGSFLLQGIPPGTYSVTITPVPPLLPVTLSNVTVTTGVVTDLGIVNL